LLYSYRSDFVTRLEVRNEIIQDYISFVRNL